MKIFVSIALNFPKKKCYFAIVESSCKKLYNPFGHAQGSFVSDLFYSVLLSILALIYHSAMQDVNHFLVQHLPKCKMVDSPVNSTNVAIADDLQVLDHTPGRYHKARCLFKAF